MKRLVVVAKERLVMAAAAVEDVGGARGVLPNARLVERVKRWLGHPSSRPPFPAGCLRQRAACAGSRVLSTRGQSPTRRVAARLG